MGKYFITGVDTPNDSVQLNREFEVIGGETSIKFNTFDINAIEGNVQGVVKTEGDVLFKGGGS